MNSAKETNSRRQIATLTLVVVAAGFLIHAESQAAETTTPRAPNIVLILADDLGYGDVSCYNAEAKVATPNLDRLAKQGVRFTDAHSPSTVCTPSRYSILTGRMCFRTGYRGVFTGVGGPCLIEEGRLTLPEMLRKKGYATAMVGKWHVGMTFSTADGTPAHKAKVTAKPTADWRNGGPGLARVKLVDFSKPITDGPIHRGFDHFFGTACCPTTDWLYAYIRGDRVPLPPDEVLDRSGLPKHPYAYDNRGGMIADDYNLEEVDLKFLAESKKWLTQHVKEKPDQPFFLFHSMQAVHLPSFAADRYKGTTKAGPHGDFIHEMDVIVGELMSTLDTLGVADNTLVMFSSDNGPETTSVVNMRADHDHDGARPWRGMKRDDWEGGHRVPFIVRWPSAVKPGSVSSEPTNLTDLMATCAAIVGAELPHDCAEDSFDISPVLRGEPTDEPIRPFLIQQTISLALSIRQGDWKLLDHAGSGGNNYERDARLKPYRIDAGAEDAPGQLFNLASDPGETKNLYREHPEIVSRLKTLLEETKTSGRSRP